MQVQEEIIGIFTNKYGCTKEEIINAESFAILGIDSLSIYSLVYECEELFSVNIGMDDIWDISSPKEFIEYIVERYQDGK